MQTRDLPSSFHAVAEPCSRFHQQSMQLEAISSTFVNFPCSHKTSRELPSNFRATTGLPVNFSCSQRTLRPLPSAIRATGRTFVNLHQLSAPAGTLLASSCVASIPSVICGQLSVQLRELLSTFINFPCGRETYR